jgi:hypothetical protein
MQDELDKRLRRYQPIGPPASLRERVLCVEARDRRAWPWFAAAAAALVTAVVLHAATGRLAAAAGADVPSRLLEAADASAVDTLRDSFRADGVGEASAQRLAQLIVSLDAERATEPAQQAGQEREP